MSPIDCVELPVHRERSCVASRDVSRARFARKPIIPGWKCVHKRGRWRWCAVGLDTIACAIRGFASDDDDRSFAHANYATIYGTFKPTALLYSQLRFNCSSIWFVMRQRVAFLRPRRTRKFCLPTFLLF